MNLFILAYRRFFSRRGGGAGRKGAIFVLTTGLFCAKINGLKINGQQTENDKNG